MNICFTIHIPLTICLQIIFYKPIDKSLSLWYNNYGKREREPQINIKEIMYEKPQL